MPYEPFITQSRNLSSAWSEVFLRLMEPGVRNIPFFVVTVNEFDENDEAIENEYVRLRLDQELSAQKKQNCQTVANTIFPQKYWRQGDSAETVFNRYNRSWRLIKKHYLNRRGVYFRRLTHFQPKIDGYIAPPVNQLEHIINTYNQGNHRRSALVAPIFDPTRDHTNGRVQGFPCLQQVAFAPDGNGGLIVTGFYVTQYIFEKAYGNYLGLCRLGKFMAQQMGLTLVQMTCVGSVAQLGDVTKSNMRPLANDIRNL